MAHQADDLVAPGAAQCFNQRIGLKTVEHDDAVQPGGHGIAPQHVSGVAGGGHPFQRDAGHHAFQRQHRGFHAQPYGGPGLHGPIGAQSRGHGGGQRGQLVGGFNQAGR